jgi:hypothetical protein
MKTAETRIKRYDETDFEVKKFTAFKTVITLDQVMFFIDRGNVHVSKLPAKQE